MAKGRAAASAAANDAPTAADQRQPELASEGPEESTTLQDRFEERVEEALAESQLDIGSLGSDVRDAMLELFRHRPKPWEQMTENEQRDVARLIESAVNGVLAEAVLLIAQDGRPSIEARLAKFAGKGGTYQATLIAQGGPEMAADLARLDGHDVLIISSDAESIKSRRDARIRPDQAPLAFDEEPGDDMLEERGDGVSGWFPDAANRKMDRIKTTTGEVLESRPMTPEEEGQYPEPIASQDGEEEGPSGPTGDEE